MAHGGGIVLVMTVPRLAEPPPDRNAPDEGAEFDEFYHAHYRSVTLQLAAYVGDLAAAQDLAQEAFCRAFARWSRVSTYEEPAAWVRKVAWNLATSRWRRVRVARSFLVRQREEHVAAPGIDRVALVAALARLPERHRRAIVLHHLADLSVAEIAAQEGVAAGTVKSWLHRGREALAAHLGDTEGGSA